MATLNGSWIEVFRAGDYGDRGRWTAQDLDRLVAAYDTRLQPAPVVVGHPKTDSPAYGWVARLRRAGQSLWAQLEKVDKGFESLLRDGRFRQRSVALYRHFAPAGGPYLRHIGFLGAQPPAVKGLAPVRFFSGVTEPATLIFTESLRADSEHTSSTEVPMPESNLQKLFDHISGFFTETPLTLAGNDNDAGAGLPAELSADLSAEAVRTGMAGSGEEAHSDSSSDVPARLAELESRLDELTAAPVTPVPPQPTAATTEVNAFVESLRAAGKFPPAFDRLGVADFLHHLAAHSGPAFACHSEQVPAQSGGAKPACGRQESYPSGVSSADRAGRNDQTPLAWFQEFLTQLPAVIHFGELSAPTGDASSAMRPAPIRFVEPRRGVEVDPESIVLAQRAESLAAADDITYAEALTRLRREGAQSQASA